VLRLKSLEDRWRSRSIELPLGEAGIAVGMALVFLSLALLGAQ
jgi:hypothetical protein